MPATASKPRWKDIDFPLPINGVYTGSPLHEVPAGYSRSMNNMLPYDSLGQKRLGQRPGTPKYFSFQMGGGAKDCQHLSQVGLANTTTGAATVQYILTVFEGQAYLQAPGSSINAIGGAVFSATRTRIEAVAYQDVLYMTDGLVNKTYSLNGGMADWTASGGSTFPIQNSEYPRYLAEWRGRIVLTHLDKGTSGAVFFAKQGDPTNFDYGAVFTPIIAVATTTNFRAGQLGDAATALIPVNEDVLYIATCNTINKFSGDPADGGIFVPVGKGIGIHNNDAWCVVGSTVYFFGSGGFYRMISGGEPELLSFDKYNANFRSIPDTGCYVELEYDAERQVVWIFATMVLTPFTTYHAAYSLVTGGFYPMSFPTDTAGENSSNSYGPIKALAFDSPAGRAMLLGCRDGYIRYFDPTSLVDGSAAIPTPTVYFPLIQPAGATQEALLNGIWITSGDISANFNCTYDLLVGKDPYSAFNAAAAKTVTVTAGGRNAPLGWRQSANSFFIKASNSTSGKTFDLERVTGRFSASGPVR